VVLVVLFAWDQYREAEAREALYFVFYDYALADTCALVTTAVERGYRLERERAQSRSGLDEASAREMKIQGWVAVDLEWANRGLGGFRNWCRDEGSQAAARLAKAYCLAEPGNPGC